MLRTTQHLTITAILVLTLFWTAPIQSQVFNEFEVNYSIGPSFRITNTSNLSDEDLVLREAQKPRNSSSLHFLLNKKLKEDLVLNVGIGILSMGYYIIKDVPWPFPDLSGDPQFLSQSESQHYFDVPVFVTKTFNGKKIIPLIQGGLIYGHYLQTHTIQGLNGDRNRFNERREYVNSSNIIAQIGVGIKTQKLKGANYALKAFYRHQLNPITKALGNEYLFQYGIEFSLIHNFIKKEE